jgi:phage recombination protein Bet
MSEIAEISEHTKPKLVEIFAERYHVDANKVMAALKTTAFKQSGNNNISNEQMMALMIVANQYKLNPFTKEIFAFPDKGSIVPVVSVDGWSRIMNEHPAMDGIEFEYSPETLDHKGKTAHEWIDCIIYRKDRSRPIRVREFFDEVSKTSGPWLSHPNRMHRHKAEIQCARIAFGFAGIYDQDEAENIIHGGTVDLVIETAHTEGQKEYFDQMIADDDCLELFVFQKTVGTSVFSSLYNSGGKGKKMELKDVVNKMEKKGFDILQDYKDRWSIAENEQDEAGLLELQEEVSEAAWELITA